MLAFLGHKNSRTWFWLVLLYPRKFYDRTWGRLVKFEMISECVCLKARDLGSQFHTPQSITECQARHALAFSRTYSCSFQRPLLSRADLFAATAATRRLSAITVATSRFFATGCEPSSKVSRLSSYTSSLGVKMIPFQNSFHWDRSWSVC